MKRPPFHLQPIPLRVRPALFEPAYGLLGRLAVRHGHSISQAFVTEMAFGIPDFLHEVECGRRLAELARLTRTAEATIAASTLVTDPTGTLWIGTERISATASHHAVSAAGRVCPHCLRADIEMRDGPVTCRPHRRVWWDLVGVVSCPLHKVLLLHICPNCGMHPSRAPASPRYCRCGHDLIRLTGSHLDDTDLAADRYLIGRLGVVAASRHSFLDHMPLHDAALAMLRIGQAAALGARGVRFKNHMIEPTLRAKLASIGFREALS